MTQEFDVFRARSYDLPGVVFHARKRPNLKGEIAARLVEHFAIVAAQENGEDSAGRQAFKLQTPEQVVIRACDIADNMVNEFERRGWLISIPAYDDIPLVQKAG
jgi:hypothetical protein